MVMVTLPKKALLNALLVLALTLSDILYPCTLAIKNTKRKAISLGVESPKIMLKDVTSEDDFIRTKFDESVNDDVFENDFIIKNGSDYVITSNTFSVTFVCKSKYPIMWKIRYPTQFTGIEDVFTTVYSERVSEFLVDLIEPENEEFLVYLIIDNTKDFNAGYLSCHSVPDFGIEADIYVYFEGKSLLEHKAETKQVHVKETMKVVLPCRAASPNIQVSLAKEKRLRNKVQWIPTGQAPFVSYNPKVGFTLDISKSKLQPEEIYGTYKCYVDEQEDEEYSFVQVLPGLERKLSFEFHPKNFILNASAKIEINQNEIVCCSGNPEDPAQGILFVCRTEAECEFLKPVLVHDVMFGKKSFYANTIHDLISHNRKMGCFLNFDESRQSLHHSTIFFCNGTHIDVARQFLTAFANPINASNPTSLLISETFDISNGPGNLTVDNKIQMWVESKEEHDLLILQIFPIDVSEDIVFRKLEKYVLRHDGIVFEGESVRVSCVTLGYYYAHGSWLQLNWKNGTRVILGRKNELSGSNYPGFDYVRGGDPSEDNFIFGLIQKTDLELTSIDCFAPIWNNYTWEKKSFALKVHSTNIPQFERPDAEVYELRLNLTGFEINCSLIPSPNDAFVRTKLTWIKDGKSLSEFNQQLWKVSFSTENDITKSSVAFEAINFETQGAYECFAENVKGKVGKTFRIFVKNGMNVSTIAISICTSIIALLVLVVGLLLFWKAYMGKRTNHKAQSNPAQLSGSMSRRPQLPKITLKNYVEADSYEEVETSDFTNVKFYENDFVTKNGSEYILSSSAVSVVFVCKASYPVVWKLPNPEHFETINIYEFGLRVTSERVSELTTDLKQPINTEFRSYLKFDNEIYRFRSGYLSCQSVANYHLQSTIYVFAEGQHTLFHSGETFTVNLTQTSSQIILPCRTSRPDISVNLFKEQKRRRNKTEWIPIQQNSSIHFDPRMGFMLDVHTLPDIKGPYKCAVADEEDEEYSLIHVAPGIETPYKFTPISTLESHVNNSLLQVQCCTGKQSSPARGNQRNCATEAECDLIKPLFVHNLLEDPESRLFSNSGDQYNLQHGCYNAYLQNYLHPATILICQGENLKLVGLFLPVYKEGLLNNTDEWNGNYEIMDIANNPPKLQIEKKISFLLESRQEPTWLSQSTSGQRISNHYYPYSEYSSYPEIGFVAGEYSRPNIFAVRSYESIFEGEDIRVTCAPLPYYYAKGGWLQVNWKNGSRMILDTDFDTDAPQHISYIRSHRLQVMDSNSRIRGIINNIDLDVESVDCFSPIWNSAKWDKRTLKLKIQCMNSIDNIFL
ncbi:unnamed protein product [Orchesella dallaii]|uniref:Platelet-derived growth factor receptor-like protein n=1 Tax=Orchesella dallaii TaxID=48710 RepID=A0ABP1S4B6_9HEXA